MNPLDIETADVLAFVTAALPRGARVLEVGAGDGRIAARLAEAGWRVTALDADPEVVAKAKARGVEAVCADFLRYDPGARFEALLFTRSFHHLSPLPDALARSRALIAPGGVLVFDEFAHDAVDLATAAWFYDAQALLETAGVLSAEVRRAHHGHHDHGHRDHGHGHAPAASPLDRWRERHGHEPGLHGGAAMLEALGSAFELGPVERRPYLYRYLVERLAPDDAGGRLFEQLRAQEARRIALGLLAPIGLRFTARVR